MPRLQLLPILAIVAAVSVVIGLTLAGGRHRSIGPFGGSQTAPDEALAQMMQTQAEILRRLDRLESSRVDRQGRLPGTPPATGPGRAGNGHNDMSAAAIAAQQASAIRERENKFVNEPLAAAWAASSERTIGKALSAASLAKEGATVPRNLESTCHSDTCRISMSFDNEQQADFTKVVFLEQIGETLPQADIFQQSNPDGSVRYLVYARRANAGAARR